MKQRQLQLPFKSRGGRRKGAGRPPKNGQTAMVSHLQRPRFEKATPAHVTLRIENDVPSLRSSRRFAVIRRAFAASRGLHGLRLVQFSVLSNHLHLIVEADDSAALTRGMQGLCIRMAKALNALLGRRGRVFADHYHSHLLRTPAEVARALAYVRTNAARHYGEAGVDYFGSARAELRQLLAAPICWLLNEGWKRAKLRQKAEA